MQGGKIREPGFIGGWNNSSIRALWRRDQSFPCKRKCGNDFFSNLRWLRFEGFGAFFLNVIEWTHATPKDAE